MILHKQQFQLLVWQGIKGNDSITNDDFNFLVWQGIEGQIRKELLWSHIQSARDREEDSSMVHNRSPEAHYRAAPRFPPGENSVRA
jgi:hypothetical protein